MTGHGVSGTKTIRGRCCIGNSPDGLVKSLKGYLVGAACTYPALERGQGACIGIGEVDMA